MRFQKGLFYKHENCKDIVIQVLWSRKYANKHKLKIDYWNISPYPDKPWPLHIRDRVRIPVENEKQWKLYIFKDMTQI